MERTAYYVMLVLLAGCAGGSPVAPEDLPAQPEVGVVRQVCNIRAEIVPASAGGFEWIIVSCGKGKDDETGS